MGIYTRVRDYIRDKYIFRQYRLKYIGKTPHLKKIKNSWNNTNSNKLSVSILIYCTSEEDFRISLLSILENIPEVSFEVIAIPIGFEVNSSIYNREGIQICKSAENTVTALNDALKIARGDFMYVLKGGSTVFGKFLDELLYVFGNFSNVGIAGSLSLHPDGTIDDAGKIILNGGVIQSLKKQKLYHPSRNYITRIDMCTPVSFLFNKFKRNGTMSSFNETAEKLWFEEFCLRTKFEDGQEIYTNPFSKVSTDAVKNNSNSAGMSKAPKPISLNNLAFNNTWKEKIDSITAINEAERLANLYKQKSIIFFHHSIPIFNDNSGDLRLKELMLKFIKLGYHVSLICKKNRITNPYNTFYQKSGIRTYYQTSFRNSKDNFLQDLAAKHVVGWYYTAESFLRWSPYVEKNFASTTSIFDMVDIHHLRLERALRLSPDKKTKSMYNKHLSFERSAAQKADIIVTISDSEQEYMKFFSPESEIMTISNIHYTKVQQVNIPKYHERQDLFFIGSQHHPNIDAVKFLVDDIMPEVWKHLPHVKLHIVGSLKAVFDESEDPRVVFHGRVEKVDPFLLNSKMMVAPLRYGAGVKGKVGQALEYFLPVVTTTIGSEGMYLRDYENVLIADGAAEFARKIIELYTDESIWYRLSNSSEKSLQPFSLETLSKQIKKIETLIP